MNFQITRVRATSGVILELGGELDLGSALQLEREVIEIVIEEGLNKKNVVLVLSDLCFIDSAGIGAILFSCKAVRRLGGKFAVVNDNEHIRRKLEIMGFSQIVNIFGKTEEAIAFLE